MDGVEGLVTRLMYGTGMRVNEALGLRVQDLAFDRSEITVHGKGNKVRRGPFPTKLQGAVREHLEQRRKLYEADKAKNMHEVYLPTRSIASTPRRPTNGAGSSCFRRMTTRPIRAAVTSAGLICTRFGFNAP